jgi:hypothetical protein
LTYSTHQGLDDLSKGNDAACPLVYSSQVGKAYKLLYLKSTSLLVLFDSTSGGNLMSPKSRLARFLRFLGILLMALTAGFTLLGGVGTSCVALNPTGFGDRMATLAPFQWLYILFVLTGVGIGLLGVRATILLVRGHEYAYRSVLVALLAGLGVGISHILVSRALRGASMPVDAVVWTTMLTLLIFLVLRIPPIWQNVDFQKGEPKSNQTAGGVAAITLGGLMLSIQHLIGATHTWNGVNYADAFRLSMTGLGLPLVIFGAYIFVNNVGILRFLLTGFDYPVTKKSTPIIDYTTQNK